MGILFAFCSSDQKIASKCVDKIISVDFGVQFPNSAKLASIRKQIPVAFRKTDVFRTKGN